jgi:hypothetical protein
MKKNLSMTETDLAQSCTLFREKLNEYLGKAHYLIPGESGLTEKERAAIVNRAVDFAVQCFTTDNMTKSERQMLTDFRKDEAQNR